MSRRRSGRMNTRELNGLLSDLNLSIGGIRAVKAEILRESAERIREEWIKLANQKLGTTREGYIKAIGPVVIEGRGGADEASIEFGGGKTGALATMVEDGVNAFNMRKTLLKGQDSRVIPIRTAAPGAKSTIESGTPVDKILRRRGRSGKQLEPFLEMAKKAFARTPVNGRVKAGTVPLLQSRYSRKYHQTDILAGGRKQAGGKGYPSSLLTFRTISQQERSRRRQRSEKSLYASNWIYPNTKPGKQLWKTVSRKIDRIIGEVTKETLDRMEDQKDRLGRVHVRTAAVSKARGR